MRSQDTAFDRKVRGISREIVEALTALPHNWKPESVVEIWRNREEPADLLYYVYHELDNRYAWYPNYIIWHPRLRSTRNDPEHGPAMFAAIRKEKP